MHINAELEELLEQSRRIAKSEALEAARQQAYLDDLVLRCTTFILKRGKITSRFARTDEAEIVISHSNKDKNLLLEVHITKPIQGDATCCCVVKRIPRGGGRPLLVARGSYISSPGTMKIESCCQGSWKKDLHELVS